MYASVHWAYGRHNFYIWNLAYAEDIYFTITLFNNILIWYKEIVNLIIIDHVL